MDKDKVIYMLERMSHSFMGETKEAIVYALKMFEQHKIEAKSWQIKIAELEKENKEMLWSCEQFQKDVMEQAKTIEELEECIGCPGSDLEANCRQSTAQAERIKLLELANSNANHLIEEEIGLKTKLQAEVVKLKEQIEGNKDWIRLTENDVIHFRKLLDKDRIKRIIQAFREHVEVKAKYTNDEFATAIVDEKL